VHSALVTALNDGRPRWTDVENLLADLWALLARVNSEKGSLPDDFDHPVRAEMAAKARATAKKALKAMFRTRKNTYTAKR
jgi:hypothetical protein